jgi:hypothetical protein
MNEAPAARPQLVEADMHIGTRDRLGGVRITLPVSHPARQNPTLRLIAADCGISCYSSNQCRSITLFSY